MCIRDRIGIATGGMTFGTSYAYARAGIEGASLPWYFFFGKFVATLASTVSGIPGGLFAPSLAVGAGMGSILGVLFGSSASVAALLGMSAYFAGVVQAPMTAFVIILEMTGNHDNVVPVSYTHLDVYKRQQYAIAVDHRDVDAGSQAQRGDQGVIEKVFRELGCGVGDKGLLPCDAMIIPAVAGQRFGARNRVFHRMRGIGAAGDIQGKVLHGDGEQPCTMGGAGGVKLVIYLSLIHI